MAFEWASQVTAIILEPAGTLFVRLLQITLFRLFLIEKASTRTVPAFAMSRTVVWAQLRVAVCTTPALNALAFTHLRTRLADAMTRAVLRTDGHQLARLAGASRVAQALAIRTHAVHAAVFLTSSLTAVLAPPSLLAVAAAIDACATCVAIVGA